MTIVTGDYETYYDKDYSLRKMSEIEYLMDPRYQTIMLSLKLGNNKTECLVGHDEIARRLSGLDPANTAWLSHNTRFDGMICALKFGFYPAMWLDTLGMARATIFPHTGRASLEKVSEYLGLPPKGDEVVRMMGVRLEELLARPNDLAAYKTYCVRDTDNCRLIFDRLRPLFNADELMLINLLLRMFIEPSVKLNPHVLAEHLGQVRADKAAVLAKVAHIDRSVFSSNKQFAALLESYGVDVPMKISKTTGLETWALARGDRAFKELCSDESQPLEVQALLAARQNVKSTLEETRTESLLRLSLLSWPNGQTGWAPVPLKYAGAHTLRLSGDGGYNWQNYGRKSRIREAVEAPPGMRIIHRDASQIEARMVSWLAGCERLTNGFARGEDVYSTFATSVYGYPVSKATKEERHVGKTSILGLGYGMGGVRFRHALFVGTPSVDMAEAEARRVVKLYRDLYHEIPALWRNAAMLLMKIVAETRPMDDPAHRAAYRAAEQASWPSIKGVTPGRNALVFPDGLTIEYPNLRFTTVAATGKVELCYDDPHGGARKLFGGMVVENISQRLARTTVLYVATRVYAQTRYRPWMTTHDSLDYLAPESEAAALDALLDREFARVPAWAAGLPLASEGGWGTTWARAEKMENQ